MAPGSLPSTKCESAQHFLLTSSYQSETGCFKHFAILFRVFTKYQVATSH